MSWTEIQRVRAARYIALIFAPALGLENAAAAEFANTEYSKFMLAVNELEAILSAPEGGNETVNYVDTSTLN